MFRRKPAAVAAPRREQTAPDKALQIVQKMHELGATFGSGYDRGSGSMAWFYRAPPDVAAQCDRLAATVDYAAFAAAIHRLPPGAITPGLMLPPPPPRG